MIDHIGLNVRDFAASRSFYERALAPLGYHIVLEFPNACGFGTNEQPVFWIVQREPYATGTHVAFHVGRRDAVHAFHDAALDAGGIDNGGPGPRPEYTPTYYAAFVHDPDGNNVEAVCHAPG
jgi:catechol 2,3-dioxygenase-like lactoylglutathione lyase family enzyme